MLEHSLLLRKHACCVRVRVFTRIQCGLPYTWHTLSIRSIHHRSYSIQHTLYIYSTHVPTLQPQFNVETDEIFEEVRIKVHNAHLVHGFLYELREKKEMR